MPLILNEGPWEKWAPKVDVVWHVYITADHNFWKVTVSSGSTYSLSPTMTDMNGLYIYFGDKWCLQCYICISIKIFAVVEIVWKIKANKHFAWAT